MSSLESARRPAWPWFGVAGAWFVFGLFADSFVMSSGQVMPKAWILLWYGFPVLIVCKAVWMAPTVFLVIKGLQRLWPLP